MQLWKTVWQFLTKLNMILPYNPAVMLLGYLPKWVGNLRPHENLHRDVYSNFIHNCQNLDANEMSFSKWMDKLWYIQTMEYYSVLKRNELSSHEKTWRKLKCILLSEISRSEEATYRVILTIWHLEKIKLWDKWCQDLGGREGWVGRAQKIYRVVKLFCMIHMIVDTCYYTFVKMHRMYNTKSEP